MSTDNQINATPSFIFTCTFHEERREHAGFYMDEMPNLCGSDLPLKRNATDDLETPPAQRLPRVIKASDNSIQSILRENNRERLYVPPIFWSPRQLQLLNCHFAREEVLLKKHAPPSRSLLRSLRDQQPYEHPIYVIAELLAPATLGARLSDVEDLLNFHGVQPLPSDRLPFYFNQRKVADIRVNGLFSRDLSIPSLAYITFGTIRSLREHAFGKRANKPISSHRRERMLRSLNSQDPAQDPYLASIVIALAQAQRRLAGGTELTCAPTPGSVRDSLSKPHSLRQEPTQTDHGTVGSFKVMVLATSRSVTTTLYVYSASITAEFLDCLDVPSQCLPSHPIMLKYSCIPLIAENKVKSLRELHTLLCDGSCILCGSDKPADPVVTS